LLLVDKLVELVQGRVHDLHADPASHLLEDGPVELHNVGAVVALHHNLQVHQQLLLLLLVHRGADALRKHAVQI
ncbi:unnamed protein product, partial [Ixodes pacificus]